MSEEPIEQDARSTVFQEALACFAEAKRREISAVVTPDLSADHYSQILFIHLAALAALRGSSATGDRELLDMAVGHERACWRHLLAGSGLDEARFDALEQAIALFTLFGGAGSAREAKVTIGRTPRVSIVPPNLRGELFDLLRRLYRRDGGLSGLQPDLLGEHLVAAALARDDELIDVALEEVSTSEQATNAPTVLTRLARREAAEGRWLARALERHLPQRRLVRTLRPQLPEETINLKGLAIDIAEHHVSFSSRRRVIGRAGRRQSSSRMHMRNSRRVTKPKADSRRWPLESLCNNLRELNRNEEALAKAEQTEAIRRELAERQPEAHPAHWALGLGNLAGRP